MSSSMVSSCREPISLNNHGPSPFYERRWSDVGGGGGPVVVVLLLQGSSLYPSIGPNRRVAFTLPFSILDIHISI